MSGTEPWPDAERYDGTGPHHRQGEDAWETPADSASGGWAPAPSDERSATGWQPSLDSRDPDSWAPGPTVTGPMPTATGATGGWTPADDDPLFGRNPPTGGPRRNGPATGGLPRQDPATGGYRRQDPPTGGQARSGPPTGGLNPATGGLFSARQDPSTGGIPRGRPAPGGLNPATGGLSRSGPATGGMTRLGPATGGLGRPRPGLTAGLPIPTAGAGSVGAADAQRATAPVPALDRFTEPVGRTGVHDLGLSSLDDEPVSYDDTYDPDSGYDTVSDDAQEDDESHTDRRGRFSHGGGSRFGRRAWSDDDPGEAYEAPTPAAKPGRKGFGWRGRIVLFVVVVAVGVSVREIAAGRGSGSGGDALGPIPTAQAVPTNYLDTVLTDHDPVVEAEFFNGAQVAAGTHTYARLARKLDKGCPGLTGSLTQALGGSVVIPATPQPAVPTATAGAKPAGSSAAPSAPTTPAATQQVPLCSQVYRALYVSEPDKNGRRVLGEVTVLNVYNTLVAQQTVAALNARKGGATPLPLPANSVPGAKIKGPNGDNEWRSALAQGHYAVMVQLAYSDGTKGKSTDGPLADAASNLRSLATDPLDERKLFGHGYNG